MKCADNEGGLCTILIVTKKNEKNRKQFYINYDDVKSLRTEAVQKLKLFHPVSIGQASRISGVSPADISVLLIYIEQLRRK